MTYHRLSNIPKHADYGTAVVAAIADVNLEPLELLPADAHAQGQRLRSGARGGLT